jgi:hypothetical protein
VKRNALARLTYQMRGRASASWDAPLISNVRFFNQGGLVSDTNIKTIHGLVLVQGALLQAIAWSKSKNTEIAFEFSQQCNGLVNELTKNKDPDKELIESVERARQSITAQLPKK